METRHSNFFSDSRGMDFLPDGSVNLVVTSPPYPMIEMWDETFSLLDHDIGKKLKSLDGWDAFLKMHKILDDTWKQVCRVLKPGGFACINIGDAVRKIGDVFCLYPNHSRIISAFLQQGMFALPAVLWRKQTNAPNKFMGSGMLPAGAYVTLEHEFILIFRKGEKRLFPTPEQKLKRQESAYFWEERNQWFSDVWFDLKGLRQQLTDKKLRKRSGAYPFALAYRLINMYSVYGDTILDPFAGTGTTMAAAMAAGRSSINIELEKNFYPVMEEKSCGIVDFARQVIENRIQDHFDFVDMRLKEGKPVKYTSENHGFPVMTRQEKQMRLFFPVKVRPDEKDGFEVSYLQAENYGTFKTQCRAGSQRPETPVQKNLF
jgi:DNA modification methylase